MYILLNVSFKEKHLARIREAAPRAQLDFAGDIEELKQKLPRAEILVTFGFDLSRELLDRAGNLRWIHAMSTGIDLFLPFDLEARGILLTSSRGVHATQMCEQIFAFMLSHVRGFKTYFSQQCQKKWQMAPMDTLEGKTAAIIGVGSIGRELACRAKSFGMTVIGTKKTAAALPCVDEVLPAEDYRLLLPRADFLVLLVPFTPATKKMIGAAELALMKPGAYLINVSRGGVVDQEALVEALKEKQIAGAGLDVTSPEPLPPEAELWSLDGVTITPHVGGVIPGYYGKIIELFCRNLKIYQNGEAPLENSIDFGRGY